MKAVLLAAGIGKRLGSMGRETPKCLLQFGGESLLERHIRALRNARIGPIIIVVGYKRELVAQEVARKFPRLRAACPLDEIRVSGRRPKPEAREADVLLVGNPAFHHGNLLSLWAAHKLVDGAPFVLMDADVLCDERILGKLVESPRPNCLLLDCSSPEGEEETYAGVRAGRVARFARALKARDYDVMGESVGFFKFSAEGSRVMFEQMRDYLDRSDVDAQYDDALQDILAQVEFGYEDVTGLPWIEIDFEEDVRRAESEVLPRITGRPAAPPKKRTTLQQH